MAIRVLVIDDSALIRKMLSELLASDADIEVVGTASDPFIAREKIKTLNPDVLTLDVEMPRMDGLTFLSNLMRLRPMPVVMVSSLTEAGANITLEALALGAVDFVSKPKLDVGRSLGDYRDEIIAKVKTAAVARLRETGSKPEASPRMALSGIRATEQIIAIGASTGGTEAIREVLVRLPADAPACVITQHIPAGFSQPFAERMDRCSAIKVFHAADGQRILPGHAYIAPGGLHLRVERNGARYLCRLSEDAAVNRHRPSVDVLFDSVAAAVGRNAVGVLLTGMGKDGAAGLLRMRQANARTIAQDERSSVVWGMPGEAVKLDAAERVLPLESIAAALMRAAADKEESSPTMGKGEVR